MREFCPLCYQNGIPARVSSHDPGIDPEQAECCRSFRGLPLLDLRAAGTPCLAPCKIACLVCGSTVVYECEPEFEKALQLIEQYEQDLLEVRSEVVDGLHGFAVLGQSMVDDLERRFTRALAKIGMAWHPRWERIVHPSCIRKASCKCVLAACASACFQHGPERVTVRASKKQRMEILGEMQEDPVIHQELQLSRKQETGRSLTSETKKATWLKTPSTLAVAKTALPLPHAYHSRPCVPNNNRKKPVPPKINARLQAAAAKCSRLDAWATKNHQDQPEQPCNGPVVVSFNVGRHAREFDPFQHGYWKVNGRDVYRFPDGRQIPVQSSVNILTDEGTLLPC